MDAAYCIAGLAFGDEGKGSVTDALTREIGARWNVRYNGGPQAAHNVVLPNGTHFCFHQLGSGSFAGARTYISRFMLIEPRALIEELRTLRALTSVQKPVVEEGAVIITPFHWMANQARERARGVNRHGSCGWGVGECREDELTGNPILRVASLALGRRHVESILDSIAFSKRDLVDPRDVNIRYWSDVYCGQFLQMIQTKRSGHLDLDGPVIFEGAQGVLLDEKHGFHPHTTWTDTTFNNCGELVPKSVPTFKLGVLRTHFTRHGHGPFPSEIETMTLPDHNRSNNWQGKFRFGAFDMVLAQYAVRVVGGIDGLALTHMDRIGGDIPCVMSYEVERINQDFMSKPLAACKPLIIQPYTPCKIAEMLGADLLIESRGPTHGDKKLYLSALTESLLD